MEKIRLTQYSHGAGCGCKISPKTLDIILAGSYPTSDFPHLLVGNKSKDDAAVYDIGHGKAIISTTDFFMPIVDDPFDFGAIASANAISDVYAMGGKPIMAIAILGWPVNQLPADVAAKVVEGSRSVCEQAGIPLAGGHSIDSPEPIFGLAVTGITEVDHIKKNNTAKPKAKLYLTKPLGIGIITTAQKKGIVTEEHLAWAKNTMLKLNDLGYELGKLPYVQAMTDVTGFGLLGHLGEICEGSGVSATIYFDRVPKFGELDNYLDQKCFPGGTTRNWDSYGKNIGPISEKAKYILADPQTSGGLLVAVSQKFETEFESLCQYFGYSLESFGYLTERTDTLIRVL